MHINIHTRIHIHIHRHMRIRIHIHVHMRIHIHMHIHMVFSNFDTCTHAHIIKACTHVHTYTHIHTLLTHTHHHHHRNTCRFVNQTNVLNYRGPSEHLNQLWWDDPATFTRKYNYVKGRGVRALGMWTADSVGDDPNVVAGMWSVIPGKNGLD